MSSDPSRPDSPIPDLDLEVGDWSGSEKDLASRPVKTVVTTRGAGDFERGAFADTEHDVKDEAAENVKMGGIANQHHPCDSVSTVTVSTFSLNCTKTISAQMYSVTIMCQCSECGQIFFWSYNIR